MSKYIQVVEDEGDEPIELPLEDDGTLLLSTLAAQFTGACGLRYQSPGSQVYRGVRLADGRIYIPEGGYSEVYITVYPKEKRKGDSLDNPVMKTKRIARRCSDLIVLGLPWKLTEDDLRKHFSQFGELVMVQIKRDPVSKQSKGFGFVRFLDYDAQVKAMGQRHNLEGRWCDLKIPNSKEYFCDSMSQEGNHPELQTKIYVGRLTEEITADDLRTYFSQFGDVTEVYLPKPFRAFAFVTFSDPEVAMSLSGDDHILKGVSIHVGNATPKGMESKGNEMMGWGKGGGRFGGADSYGAVGTSGRGSRGGGYGAQGAMGGQNYGGYAAGGNQFQMTNAMMAAAQAALYGFMSQAAAGGAIPGYQPPQGGRGAGGATYGAPSNYNNAGNTGGGSGYGSSRFSNVSQAGSQPVMNAYGTVTGAGQPVSAGGYNGSGGYVPAMEMDAQVTPGGSATGTRWN